MRDGTMVLVRVDYLPYLFKLQRWTAANIKRAKSLMGRFSLALFAVSSSDSVKGIPRIDESSLGNFLLLAATPLSFLFPRRLESATKNKHRTT
jgi:hypothetical protein